MDVLFQSSSLLNFKDYNPDQLLINEAFDVSFVDCSSSKWISFQTGLVVDH